MAKRVGYTSVQISRMTRAALHKLSVEESVVQDRHVPVEEVLHDLIKTSRPELLQSDEPVIQQQAV